MSGKNSGVITPRNCDSSVRLAIQQLVTKIVGLESTPTFAGLTLSGLTASRLIASGGSKELVSVPDLAEWIAGTTNQVTVTDDGDGTVTLSTPQDIHTGATPTFADLYLSNFSNGEKSIDGILDSTLNSSVLDAIIVTDEGGLNITWTTGEIWNHTTKAVVTIDAEESNQACTDNAINYLKWVSGTALTLDTTKPVVGEVSIASINCAGGDIIEINHIPISSVNINTSIITFQDMFPSIVTSGLVVSEHAGGNAFDVDMSAGIYYSAAYSKESVDAQDSTVDNLVRWYKSGASAWTPVTGQTQIDTTQWNDGTSLTAVTASKYYRSLFFITSGGINWIYPIEEFNTIAQAIAGQDPPLPAGLTDHPKSTTVILRGDDAAFPTAGGVQWIDRRPIIGNDISGSISDHGNLFGLTDDDHTQYLLANGTRTLSGSWNMGNEILTNVNIDTGNIDTNVVNTEWDAAYTHVNSDGSDHSIVNSNTTAIALNTTHRGLTSGNPHSVTPSELSLVIGTDVQAHSDALDDLHNVGVVTGDSYLLVGTGAGTLAWETDATLRTSIGVDAAGTAAGLVGTHESTYNHSHYNDAYTHITNNGSDHSYIDQDLRVSASPLFAGMSIANVDTTITRVSAGTIAVGGTTVMLVGDAPTAHVHDGDTLQFDGIDSDAGAFSFNTTGKVTFNQETSVAAASASNSYINLHITDTNSNDDGIARVLVQDGTRAISFEQVDSAYSGALSEVGDAREPTMANITVSTSLNIRCLTAIKFYAGGGAAANVIGSITTTGLNLSGGTITATNYTAANLLTACTTNAGTLDFSTAGRTLTVDETQTIGNLHTDARAATWLAANHETTYTHSDIAANTAHRGSDGSDHSYLNQAVTTGASPQFTGLTLSAGNVALIINGTGGAIDNRRWDLYTDVGNNRFAIRAINDAVSSAEDGLTFVRSGATIASVSFPHGAVYIDETLGVTGAITSTGGIVMANNTTIGQTAGPLLRFDDTNNFLEITQCRVGIGTTTPSGILQVGTTDPLAAFGTPKIVCSGDFYMVATNVGLNLDASGADPDNRVWNITTQSASENLIFRTINDAGSAVENWLVVERTGITIDSISFPNGDVDVTNSLTSGTLHADNGVNFDGAITNLTIVDGIITAAS